MKRRGGRGVSLGTVVMLTVTCLVLGGYCALLPRMSGAMDISTNASEIAVAFDQSLVRFTDGTAAAVKITPLPPEAVLPVSGEATAPPAPTAAPSPKLTFTLCASGSFTFNTAVRKALTDKEGYRFEMLLEPISGYLASDFSVATLCNSVVPSAKLTDTNVPAELMTALRASGVDALCMGYYGALDYGVAGLGETRRALTDAGILPYGVYESQAQRDALTLTNINGVSLALLSYQSELSAIGKKKATAEEQSFAVANLQLPGIAADIQAARAQGAQVVIVSLCWGKSTATAPTDTQKQLAQGIADAGADVILGTHPEAVQPIEILTANRGDGKYHPVLCAYSLGNLFTHNREKRLSLAGLLLQANVQYDPATGLVAFDDLGYTPTYCWRGKENGVQRYRVLCSSAAVQPAYVDQDQAGVMERCLAAITEVMAGSVFAMRN